MKFGSIGDDLLPESFQEQVVLVAFYIGLWSHAKKHILLKKTGRQIHYSKNERKQADKYTILKMKANTPAPEGAYLCTKPKLTVLLQNSR
jgi:hypothetical protein